MLTTTLNPTSLPPRRAERKHPSPRFGSVAAEAVKQGVADIAHLKMANRIQKILDRPGFKWANNDVRVGGLSLEDVAGRLQTAIGVYLLQGYFAIKDDKHPWETNGRNAIVWLMTLALTSLTKSENYGVNTIFLNPFMKQKHTPVRFLPFLQRPFDNVRMDMDYLDIIEKCGIKISDSEKAGAMKGKKALWASSWLDANKVEKIQNKLIELNQKGSLNESEQKLKEAIPKFFKRINAFNLASTAIITAATVYFIGGVAMRIVNKFISPLDKDFDGHKTNQPGATTQTSMSLPQRSATLSFQPGNIQNPIIERPYRPTFQPGFPPSSMILPLQPGSLLNQPQAFRYGLTNGQGGLN
jgi:hypothetical protein